MNEQITVDNSYNNSELRRPFLGVDIDNDVITCPVPYGGMLLFNNLTPHRRLVLKTT